MATTLTAKETQFAMKSDWAYMLAAGLVVRVRIDGQETLRGHIDASSRDAYIREATRSGVQVEIVEAP